MKQILSHFPVKGEALSFEPLRGGHINKSWLVTTDAGERYVLQWVNRYVFPNIDAIMENLRLLREYLIEQGDAVPMISFIDTFDGRCWLEDEDGSAWRLYRFVDDSVALLRPRDTADFAQCAMAYGRFQYALRGFPAAQLEETIPRFHDTPNRYAQLREAMEADPCGRRAELGEELAFAFAREERAGLLQACRDRGEVPLRVTHNDTKMSNVLLDVNTREALCVIDLDTVMPGLSAYDFGDAIRAGASTGGEDEAGIGLDLDYYRAFLRSFLEACPHLTARERELLPLGAWTMTLECGLRFLADDLNGDKYFSISRPRQNLSRARAMFSLAADMEKKWAAMTATLSE